MADGMSQVNPAALALCAQLPPPHATTMEAAPSIPQPALNTVQALCISVPVDLTAVRPKVAEALQFLVAQGVSPEDLAACELALVEACNNAILYSFDAETPVGIEIHCCSSRIDFQVVDHTFGFDLPALITLPEDEAEHGRGLFLIQSMMDDMLYLRSSRENRLCLTKRRQVLVPKSGPAEPITDVEKQLALSRQVLSSMASELYQQVLQSRQQQEEWDNRLLAHELEIARKIQQSLLPKVFPALPGFSVSGFCLSARQVGGDFYDLVEMPDGRLLLAVADVMGKGVPAALFAATLRTLLRAATQWTQQPADLLGRINQLLYQELTSVDMFITAQLAVLDTQQGWLRVASAGHNPLIYVTPDSEPVWVSPEGMPLGILPEIRFQEQAVSLRRLKTALLFTDGLTEAPNATGELFGQHRLTDWLLRNHLKCQSAGAYADSFLTELTQFQGATAPRDDQTFLILTQESGRIVPVSERLLITS